MSRIGKIVGGLGLAIMLVVSFALAAYADDASRYVSGTMVNGVGVGGLTVEEAKNRIEDFYAKDYKLTIHEKDGAKEYIDGSEIGYKVTAGDGLQAILDGQNETGRIGGPSVDRSYQVAMQAVFDDAAMTAKINSLSCISGSGIVETKDAHISDYQEGVPFTIIPQVQGNNVDVARVTAYLKAAVAISGTDAYLESEGCYYNVQVTSEDVQLNELLTLMNQCREMVITYSFGNASELLTGDIICTWITGSENGQVNVDRDKAAAYVKALAGKYDTAGTARNFHTASGRDVTLTGPFGWKLNQAVETDALIGMIRTGQTQTREPQYSQSAVSRNAPDWGNTYVEIDLTGQHVYMFKDGVMVWDAPCVTGNVSKNYTTPEGIYSLAYKQTDRILRGAKKADGTYEYESHVDYWMPFNGGIGLHDASWRGKFGGTIYQKNGSHGCINLPPKKAKLLYELIYKGIPVICYN